MIKKLRRRISPYELTRERELHRGSPVEVEIRCKARTFLTSVSGCEFHGYMVILCFFS